MKGKRVIAAALTFSLTAAALGGCSNPNAAWSLLQSVKGLQETKTAETEIYTNTGTEARSDGKDLYVEVLDDGFYEYEEYAPGYGYTAYEVMPAAAGGVMYDQGGYYEPWDSGEYSWPDWNTEEYSYIKENSWQSTNASPFSTFAADVDTASYANVRRLLLEGKSVPKDAVRLEEMINYFDYDYPEAEGEDPFSVTVEIAPCPWNKDTQLLLAGLKAKEIPDGERAPSNLVFLIDVSGSMDEYNKLPLVQRAFRLLINELGEEDTVSLVTYANNDHVILEGVSGKEKTKICDAVEDLEAYGGTNGSAGLNMAYKLAEENFIEGGNNRVILATDGDLNIGITDEGSLTRLIQEKAKSGVQLSVLGFGEGNISDTNMQALADNGNGNYSYIDDIAEARKVLIDEAGGTLFTVAKDVKLQLEFNPQKVKGYRLIGYENRTMAAEDFADDTKDGGEIGSGHTVTALYEIVPAGSDFEIPEVESRYGTTGTAAQDAQAGAFGDIDVAEIDEVDYEEDGAEAPADRQEEETAPAAEEVKGTEEIAEAAETAATGEVLPAVQAYKELSEGTTEEIAVPDYSGEWGVLHIRYKEPNGVDSFLIDTIIDDSAVKTEMSDNLSWAAGVAQAGMVLRDSEYKGDTDLQEVRDRLKTITGGDEFKEEFLYLLTKIRE